MRCAKSRETHRYVSGKSVFGECGDVRKGGLTWLQRYRDFGLVTLLPSFSESAAADRRLEQRTHPCESGGGSAGHTEAAAPVGVVWNTCWRQGARSGGVRIWLRLAASEELRSFYWIKERTGPQPEVGRLHARSTGTPVSQEWPVGLRTNRPPTRKLPQAGSCDICGRHAPHGVGGSHLNAYAAAAIHPDPRCTKALIDFPEDCSRKTT